MPQVPEANVPLASLIYKVLGDSQVECLYVNSTNEINNAIDE